MAKIVENIGILGIDWFEEYNATLKISKRMGKTKVGKVKIHKYETILCAKLQAFTLFTAPVTIPAVRSEMFIPDCINKNCKDRMNIVEPIHGYVGQCILAARS